MFRIFKWSGLVLSLIFLVSFLFSIRRAATWTSYDTKYQIEMVSGMMVYAWRPEGWKIENEKYPSHPGWGGIAEYGNDITHVTWWFDFSSNKHFEGIGIPLWIPWIIITIPASLLWYSDRNNTYQFFQRLAIRICPSKLKKISFRMVVLWSFIHFFIIAFKNFVDRIN